MSRRKKHSINVNDLGLNESIRKIEKLSKCIEEIDRLVIELGKEGIEIRLKIELK